ncbi:MFS transporter [Streptomyces sp. Rer75]|uniref:MFS transporter n=1 Tax=Streptomyces sp. Rer75 TaxID=2750011 RepID=UPI0015CF87B9|nr:MFS transporter [Streptomyces sp. Rer75]QLH22744.1 MFS transporter [Streptomyces sp. Rer75]
MSPRRALADEGATDASARPDPTAQPPDRAAGQSVFQTPYTAMTWGIVLSVGLVAFESMGVATVLPKIAGALGGLDAYGWGFSALMLANLIGTVAAGRSADRRGPARPLGIGLAVFAAGCALAGAAPNWPVFLAGRFVQGLGVGAVMALAYTVIGLHYPEHLRARMFALVSGAWTVPSLAGPAVAGLIAEHVHWRGVFILLLPLIALAWAMAVPPLARRGHPNPPAADAASDAWWRGPVARGILVAAGTAVLLGGLQFTNLALLLPLALLGSVAAVLGLRTVLPTGTLRGRRGVPTGVLIRFLLCGAYFGSEAFLPLGLTELRGLSTTEAGLGLSAGAIAWVLGAAWQGRADDRWSGRSRALPIAIGCAILAAGVAVIAAGILIDSVPALVAVVGWAVGGVGMGIAFNAATTDAMEQAPADRHGEASGAMQLAQTLATAVLTGLGGAAIALAHAHDAATATALTATFALTTTLAVLGVATAHRIRPRA